jgi:hypothetical protein
MHPNGFVGFGRRRAGSATRCGTPALLAGDDRANVSRAA